MTLNQTFLGIIVLSLLSFSFSCKDSPSPTYSLTIFAASSLTDVFNEIGLSFESKHDKVRLSFNFSGSSTLRTQIDLGARADIFASADRHQMGLLESSNLLLDKAEIFTRNSLVVITSYGNDKVQRLDDLASSDIRLVTARPEVPAGAYAQILFRRLDKQLGNEFYKRTISNIVSEEASVRHVLAKVILGEADAGIVYSSDILGNDSFKGQVIPMNANLEVLALYTIAPLRDTTHPEYARKFVNYLASSSGQEIFKKHGFRRVES
jgi:molybdate transport system substrate-binding protein